MNKMKEKIILGPNFNDMRIKSVELLGLSGIAIMLLDNSPLMLKSYCYLT